MSARLRLSSAVLNSHSGWGIVDKASVDDTSVASFPFGLILRLIRVYCPSTGERVLRVYLTANERLIIAHFGVLTQELQLSKPSYDEI